MPYVTLASPGVKHACPASAACWSPAIPAIGTAAPSSVASATTPVEGTIRGSTSRGTPNSSRSSSSHSSEARPQSSVREAFVRSVSVLGAAGQPPHQPAVDRPEHRPRPGRGRRGRAATAPSWPRSTGWASGRCARGTAPPAAPGRRRPCGRPARRSRDATGRPVRRSHSTAVSRWLVMPIACRSPAPIRASASATTAAWSTLCQISSGSCSTQPGCGKYCARARDSRGRARERSRRRPGKSSRSCLDRSPGSRAVKYPRGPGSAPRPPGSRSVSAHPPRTKTLQIRQIPRPSNQVLLPPF